MASLPREFWSSCQGHYKRAPAILSMGSPGGKFGAWPESATFFPLPANRGKNRRTRRRDYHNEIPPARPGGGLPLYLQEERKKLQKIQSLTAAPPGGGSGRRPWRKPGGNPHGGCRAVPARRASPWPGPGRPPPPRSERRPPCGRSGAGPGCGG